MTLCKPGFVAGQQQSCPDQDAVGIQSISQSADKTKLYITLTDGTTQTFTLPVGATGSQGIPGINGAAGFGILYNDLTTTNNTVGTTQAIKKYKLPANTVTLNGSEIRIRCNFSGVAPSNTVLGQIEIGSTLLAQGTTNSIGTLDAFIFDLTITKTGTGTGSVSGTVSPINNGSTVGTIQVIFPNPIAIDWTVDQTINVNVTAGTTTGAGSSQLEVSFYQFGI